MSHHIPQDVQNDMLFAVDNFDEAHAVGASGISRDYTTDTKTFWDAFSTWAPLALVGDFSMTTNADTGAIVIVFRPVK